MKAFDIADPRAHLEGEGQVVRIAMSIAAKLACGALALSALAATAAPAAADTRAPCFFINQWQGWKADGPNILYLRVNMRDIYRVDLSAGSEQLTWPGSYHLISRVQGSDSVCGPLDLQLAVSDSHGFYQPLIARSLVKLTPEEAAALPARLRP
ncbi:MAG TPA: hypothetical protein VGH15_03675 [Caulobacteraceae bacterium]